MNRQDASGLYGGKLLEEAPVQEFAANLRGELIRPEDDGYDAARAIYNGTIASGQPSLYVLMGLRT